MSLSIGKGRLADLRFRIRWYSILAAVVSRMACKWSKARDHAIEVRSGGGGSLTSTHLERSSIINLVTVPLGTRTSLCLKTARPVGAGGIQPFTRTTGVIVGSMVRQKGGVCHRGKGACLMGWSAVTPAVVCHPITTIIRGILWVSACVAM